MTFSKPYAVALQQFENLNREIFRVDALVEFLLSRVRQTANGKWTAAVHFSDDIGRGTGYVEGQSEAEVISKLQQLGRSPLKNTSTDELFSALVNASQNLCEFGSEAASTLESLPQLPRSAERIELGDTIAPSYAHALLAIARSICLMLTSLDGTDDDTWIRRTIDIVGLRILSKTKFSKLIGDELPYEFRAASDRDTTKPCSGPLNVTLQQLSKLMVGKPSAKTMQNKAIEFPLPNPVRSGAGQVSIYRFSELAAWVKLHFPNANLPDEQRAIEEIPQLV